jgi:hypothetical protein
VVFVIVAFVGAAVVIVAGPEHSASCFCRLVGAVAVALLTAVAAGVAPDDGHAYQRGAGHASILHHANLQDRDRAC